MVRTILLPLTTHDIDDAIHSSVALAGQAVAYGATVLVLETDCLHGVLTSIEPGYEDMELRRIHSAAERVADSLRANGASVEVAWECIRMPRRPVDVETVRRHGADAVFLPHAHRPRAFLEAVQLRRLRRDGITVLEPTTPAHATAAGGRVATQDD
ncbi:MAG: hypothetical protein AB7R89_13550 [Dehalococcoidia bacterium]